MDTFDKVYVMMFGISNIVAGGPIYNANKIRFLESKGWNVVVFPVDSGKVYIKPLEKYNNNSYDFIHFWKEKNGKICRKNGKSYSTKR